MLRLGVKIDRNRLTSWVAVRSTPNAQFLTFGEIKLQLRTSRPINCELQLVAPRSGGNGHRLAVFDPCHDLAVDQNSIRPNQIQPSPCGSVDRDLAPWHRRIVSVAFRLIAVLIEQQRSRVAAAFGGCGSGWAVELRAAIV